jgi:hypothetical protein
VSLFNTKIKVDLEAILANLPKGAFVQSVGWDAENCEVVVLWECERFYTGLTVPVLLPAEDLKMRKLPAGVRDLSKKQPAPKVQPQPQEESPAAQSPKPDPRPVIRTEKEFAQAIESGKRLEFWGLTSIWLPVPGDHVFTAGYLYREREEKKVVDGAAIGA